MMECANMEGLFRIIQSIPAPIPEPYKQWLAQVGHERIMEFMDPESVSRNQESKSRAPGLKNASGPTTNLESVLSMLGEAAAVEILRNQDSQGFFDNDIAAAKGVQIADKARKKVEATAGGNISGPRNCLEDPDNQKKSL